MSCRVYINKFGYDGIERGQRKKRESENGLSVLSYALEREHGISPARLVIARGEHGKPYFPQRPDICFSISHSGDYAAAALCETPVGVDIQIFRPIKNNLINKLCDDTELRYINTSPDPSRAFIHLWTLKESYIKAIGKGMAFPMDEINFDLTGKNAEEGVCGRFSNKEGLYYLHDFGQYSLAVCAL